MKVTRFPAVLLLIAGAAYAQTDWPSFGNDPGAMRYSAAAPDQRRQRGTLQPAWTFRTGKPGSEAVPIVIDGVMYVTRARRRLRPGPRNRRAVLEV